MTESQMTSCRLEHAQQEALRKVLRACSMRHLTSDWVKGRGMLSTRRARSCAQYSNTRKMLRGS